jgi:molybdopterin/thiamine biosynthesis adenylyltransferase
MRRAPHVLVFRAGGVSALRDALLTDAPVEAARFLLARPVRTPTDAWRLLVYDAIELAPEDYVRRSEVAIELPPAVVAKVMQRARRELATIVLAHSHPFAEVVAPSAHDLEGEALLLPAFRRRVPGVPHARLIVGLHSLHGALFEVGGGEYPLDLVEVGADVVLLSGVGTRSEGAGLRSSAAERYDRQVRAFGTEGQQKLAQLHVAIVGLGGTGSIVAQQLAHLGVGSFLLVDPDTVEETNLNRVVGARPADVGRPKVDVARDMIIGIHPRAKVEALKADARDRCIARRMLDADVFLVCTDSQGSRAVLTQIAYQYLVPGFDVGVVIHADANGVTHVSGRVQMLAPGLPCLLCSEVLDSEAVRRDLLTDDTRAADPYIVGVPTPQPAVVSINGAASSLAVTMLLSAITGIPYAARNQRLRLELGVVSRIEVAPRADCPVCSPGGALARGDSWPLPGRVG